jgi:hypothetical protein
LEPGIGNLFAVIIHDGILYGLVLLVGVICAEFVTRSDALGLPVTLVSAAIIAATYTRAAVIARLHFAINVELGLLRNSVILIMTGMGGAFVVAIVLSLLLTAVAVRRSRVADLAATGRPNVTALQRLGRQS